MSTSEAVLGGVFFGWWALSIGGQSKARIMNKIRAYDLFHLIPNCRFFAPVPACRDYHLEYRIRAQNGEHSRWERIVLLEERCWWTSFWNPRKRLRKAFNTAVRRIARSRKDWGDRSASQSLSYIQLLIFVTKMAAGHYQNHVQFRILSSSDFAEEPSLRLNFISDWHRTK
jgi:hypothetical protein